MQSCDLIFNQYLPFWRSLDPSDCEFLCHNTQKFSYKKGYVTFRARTLRIFDMYSIEL